MSAQVEDMSVQAQELAHTAESLKGLVALFKLDDPATFGTRPAVMHMTPLRRVA